RNQFERFVPLGRCLYWPDSQGGQACRSAGAAIYDGRAGHQSQDRQGAWPHHPAPAARPRRRGDRMTAKMKRRQFITLLGGAAATWPFAARAQPGERLRRVGVLTALAESDLGWRRNFAGFIAGLREAGWTEGQNFHFEFRYGPGGSVDQLRAAATELIAPRPDVILAVTSVAARLVAEQTQSIPIVFLLSIDPVAEGLVASVARPGGNITGFTQSDFDLGGKWLQLLKEIAP